MNFVKKEVNYTKTEKYSCLEFLRKNSVELNLTYCGKESCHPGQKYGPASRQEYLLHYIIEGEGTFQTAERTWHLKKHDAFLIIPEEITLYMSDSVHPWSYIWIAFNGIKALECLEHAGFSRTHRIGHFHKESELLHCVETILESHQLTYYNDLIRQSQLISFLAILIREYEESTSTPDSIAPPSSSLT